MIAVGFGLSPAYVATHYARAREREELAASVERDEPANVSAMQPVECAPSPS